jgi:hypothetical protein
MIHSLPPEQTLTRLVELFSISVLFLSYPGFLRKWKHWCGQIGAIDRAIAEPGRQAFTNEMILLVCLSLRNSVSSGSLNTNNRKTQTSFDTARQGIRLFSSNLCTDKQKLVNPCAT